MSDEPSGLQRADEHEIAADTERTMPVDAGAPGHPVDPSSPSVAAPAVDANLVRAIEAIVLVATEPVEPSMLAGLLGQPEAMIEDLCRRLAEAYEEAGHGFVLARVAGGYRFQTHPDCSPYVERFVLDGQRARLSGAALETLAIVAYKQPISRAQVASIRGVDPDGVLRTLQARGYIDQVGRDPGPGQAVLWGTTPLFLEKLGLNSVADLPPLAEFVPGADVVEALEHGLRVPTAKPSAPAPAAPAPAPSPVPLPAPAPGETPLADTDELPIASNAPNSPPTGGPTDGA